ncbi:MAG: ribosome rescue GTPase HflX [Pseudomonadota bacterium]
MLFFDRPQWGEKTLVVHVDVGANTPPLDEFQMLAQAAGAEVIHTIQTTRRAISAGYFIGEGKLEEIRIAVTHHEIELVLFNAALTPVQQRNIERTVKARVVDRTGLILDIFAQRARTYEGKLQVELAQLEHLATRLVRGWTHLERQRGGIGLRGPGETQLESDRRVVRDRITSLKRKLEKVKKQRTQSRQSRQRAELPIVALVGYTNVGKSTLFNALTASEVDARDQLFATLDPTVARWSLPGMGTVILADTVGFVTDLPHQLVAAFRATLEEVLEADLILHVVDAAAKDSETFALQKEAVLSVLSEMGADEIPRLMVFNKIDVIDDERPHVENNEEGKVIAVWISAHQKIGLDLLTEAIPQRLKSRWIETEIYLTPQEGKIRAQLYEAKVVLSETAIESDGWNLTIKMPLDQWHLLCSRNPELLKKS